MNNTSSFGTPSASPHPRSPILAPRWRQGHRRMGLGLMMPISELGAFGDAPPRFADMLEMTRLANDVGFDAVWVPDHLVMRHAHEGNVARGVWECWTTVAGLAAATERIQLASFVTCTGFRNPGIIAKMAEVVDDISGGRFILGLGAGWHEPDYEMFGFPFDHRVSRFEEAIKIIHTLAREGAADFNGDYYELRDAINRPRGPRADIGGPPILVGGTKPRMLRLTATYADAWNDDFHKEPATVAEHIAALNEACRDVGRDPDTLVQTTGSNIALPGYLGRRPNPITGNPEELAQAILDFRELGVSHYVCGLDPCTPRAIEHFATVIEMLDKHENRTED